jgi:exopolysaccharide production protein ExoQ
MFTGVSFQKNGLGELCLIFGIYFCWNLFFSYREGNESDRRLHFIMNITFLSMIAWLMYMANSSTALACLFAAICLFLVGRLPSMTQKPRRILLFCVTCIILYGIMEMVFDVKGTLISMLGRKPDLTSRVPMWEGLIAMDENPLAGYGWESFWLGERLRIAVERWGMRNAHNGYLELYLNLGLIGLALLFVWILCGLRNVSRHLAIDYPAALLRLSFILVVVLFSWTEISFFGPSNMLVLLVLGTMDVSPRNTYHNTSSSELANWQGDISDR